MDDKKACKRIKRIKACEKKLLLYNAYILYRKKMIVQRIESKDRKES